MSTITTPVVRALESAWGEIRRHYPEVPAAVVVLASGSERGQLSKYGHYAQLRWHTNDGQLPEVLVAGEGLNRGPVEVLTTLIHEASHAVADVRGIQDTSRQGRYHNRRFRQVAREMGLEVSEMPPFGFARTTLPELARARYGYVLKVLGEVLTMHRVAEGPQRGKGGGSRHLLAVCGCERKVRISRSTLEEGPILCGLCGQPFVLQAGGEEDDQDGDE